MFKYANKIFKGYAPLCKKKNQKTFQKGKNALAEA